jgi:glucose/mannose transport system permease protein
MRRSLSLFIFSAPAVILVGIFCYIFAGWNTFISLMDWRESIISPYKFVGLFNYEELFSDSLFIKSLTNNLLLALAFTITTIALGLIMAITIDYTKKPFKSFLQVIYLLPFSLSFVVSATLWMWMFAPSNGAINTILSILGLDQLRQPWITSPHQSLFCVFIVYVWQFSGYAGLIYYAGICGIKKEILEAADIDGATGLQKYMYVIIPMLKNETLSITTILLFYAFRVFDLVYVLTGGGPALSSEVLATYMFRLAFNQNLFSYAAAIGSFSFFLSALVMIPLIYYSRRGMQR